MLARNCGDHKNDRELLDKMPDCGAQNNRIRKIPVATMGPSRGLGDTIAKITSAVGIKPCGGCKKRQAALNERFPYRKRG
jgi:hypothetical protein